MLAKNRKPTKPDLKALTETEKLVGQVAEVIYDEHKIPKRRRQIGERMLDNAVSAYEKMRVANRTPLFKSKELADKRIDTSSSAEIDLMNLCTDIKLLPSIIPSVNGDEKWFAGLSLNAVSCKNITNKWVRSDMARADKHFAESEEKSSEPVLQEAVRFHVIPSVSA